MKHTTLRAVLFALCSLAGLFVFAACGSSSPTPPGSDATDSSLTAGSDATDASVAAGTDSDPGDDTTDAEGIAEEVAGEADTGEPGCGYEGTYLIPGPCEEGHDAELAAKARRIERTWQTISAAEHGANTDVWVSLDDRPIIDAFINETDGWDFEAYSGKTAADVIVGAGKIAGLYAGVGIAADAYRYGVFRDQGYPAEEVDRARQQLLRGLESFDRAAVMPGVRGVIARSTDNAVLYPNPTPLFDDAGNPLPEIKNNGAWRADESGLYPDHVWEDSCSRDYMLGWATAAGAAWEVIVDDETFGDDVRDMLKGHAKDLGDALMTVRTDPSFCIGLEGCLNSQGHDLQIPDGDGRRTLHGCLHEHDLDCKGIVEFIDNGFNAVMALGFVATWAYVSGDPVLTSYLNDELIEQRNLHTISRDSMVLVALGEGANWSAWNMAFGGIWLAQRYVFHTEARAALRVAVKDALYDVDGATHLPVEVGHSLFDFIYASGAADLGAGIAPGNAVDQAAIDRGLTSLIGFAQPPYWNDGLQNCPESFCECANSTCPASEKVVEVQECVAPDGTEFHIPGCYGWKGLLISDEVVPMAIRPPSNYHWRSSPYRPNEGIDGELSGTLLPSVDFRIAYWLGRWARVSE